MILTLVDPLSDLPSAPPPAIGKPEVIGKIEIEFMSDNTFRIHWPQGKVDYLQAIGALHVAINDLYVKAAGIQVKLPSGEMGDIDGVDE